MTPRFRIYDKSRNKMWYMDSLTEEGSPVMLIIFGNGKATIPWGLYDNNISENRIVSGADEGNVLMQWSGLYDKNKTPIYEGDTLKMIWGTPWNEIEIIVNISFESGAFWFTGSGYTDCNWHFYNESEREIIGNIYPQHNINNPYPHLNQ